MSKKSSITLRIVASAIAFLAGLAEAQVARSFGNGEVRPSWLSVSFALAAPVVLTPIPIIALAALYGRLQHSAKQWTPPNMGSDFLTLRDPMHLIHALGLGAIGLGAGWLLPSAWGATKLGFQGLHMLATGVMILVSVKGCVLIFPSRYKAARTGDG